VVPYGSYLILPSHDLLALTAALSTLARTPPLQLHSTAMAKTKGQARQTRLLAIACGTPPSIRERDSDGFGEAPDRFSFSECSDCSISDRFKGVRDGIDEATSDVFKVVKLKLAQPLEDQAVEGKTISDEFGLIPPPTSSATRSAAALDAAWPDTLLFAVAIGNLAASDVLPFAQRLDLPGSQQHELSARLGGGDEPILPSRRRLAYGPAPEELGLLQSLEVWASAGCKRPFGVLVAKPVTHAHAETPTDTQI
jgi:hypothetical protein